MAFKIKHAKKRERKYRSLNPYYEDLMRENKKELGQEKNFFSYYDKLARELK
jgi:hypothetical protein